MENCWHSLVDSFFFVSFLFIGTCTLARVIAIKMELCSSSAVTTTTAEATEDQKSESKNTAGVVPSSDVDATTAVDDEIASPIIKVSATNALPFSWAHGGGGEPPMKCFSRRTPWGTADSLISGVSYCGPVKTLALLNAAIEEKTGIPIQYQLIFYHNRDKHEHVVLCPKTAKYSLGSGKRISEETDLIKLHGERGQDVCELHLMAIWPEHCSLVGGVSNSHDRDEVAAFYQKRCVGACTCGDGSDGTNEK